MEAIERFWLQDGEPSRFDESLEEIVNALRGGAELPATFLVEMDGQTSLVVNSFEDIDENEGNDMMINGVFGEEGWPIQIWWYEEGKEGHVDTSCYMEGALERLARRWDALPPVDCSTDTVEVYELLELGYQAALDVMGALDDGDLDEELECLAMVYGDNAKKALRACFTRSAELAGRDANGNKVTKFNAKLQKAKELYSLLCSLSGIQADNVELTVDLYIMYQPAT